VVKNPKALVIVSAIAALCGCDPETSATVDSGTEFPSDGATAASCDGTDDGLCPCASATDGDTRYLFCLDVATWEQARDRCADYGYRLVQIDDEAEQEFVWTAATDAVGRQDWWIGLTDADTEGEFVWSDGSPLGGFAPWAPDQPDQGGVETVEEDCVELNESNEGQWNDLACGTDYLDFICEGSAN
jgi:hypothetical protein